VGVESAVYVYIPRSGEADRSLEILKEAGSERIDGTHFVLRGPMHWIDVQLESAPCALHFRLAFCNPDEGLDVLGQILEGLSAADPGEVVDLNGKQRWDILDDAAWQSIARDFEGRRQGFRKNFGEFTAAISADEVFDRIRETP
jgi:hypothetical protein